MIKFPTDYGIEELHGDQMATRECYVAMMEMDDHLQAMMVWRTPDSLQNVFLPIHHWSKFEQNVFLQNFPTQPKPIKD